MFKKRNIVLLCAIVYAYGHAQASDISPAANQGDSRPACVLNVLSSRPICADHTVNETFLDQAVECVKLLKDWQPDSVNDEAQRAGPAWLPDITTHLEQCFGHSIPAYMNAYQERGFEGLRDLFKQDLNNFQQQTLEQAGGHFLNLVQASYDPMRLIATLTSHPDMVNCQGNQLGQTPIMALLMGWQNDDNLPLLNFATGLEVFDPTITDIRGFTPLIYAARYATLSAVEVLLRAGASPNSTGRQLEQQAFHPLLFALENPDLDARVGIVNCLFQRGAEFSQSQREKGQETLFNTLLERMGVRAVLGEPVIGEVVGE